MNRRHFRPYRYDRGVGRRSRGVWAFVLVVLLVLTVGYAAYLRFDGAGNSDELSGLDPKLVQHHGKVIKIESTKVFSAAEASVIAQQNYGSAALPVTTGITKITFSYTSQDQDGKPLVIYGRAYLPNSASGKLPIFAFAPGTTGIGDQCAASVEQPQKVNWGNYDSHMIMYASQGYVGVTTDYEGMRDPNRLHHYMVGPLEGRAMLDAVLAVARMPESRNLADTKTIFLAGYSQGGHAAYWGDKIASDYAPQLGIAGVVGFGPVMSVKQTLGDVAYGANINWFGPYVLASYSDYYKQDYQDAKILQPQWIVNLAAEVNAHCIDTDIPHWGRDPSKVYVPAFLDSYTTGTMGSYVPAFSADLDKNATGDQTTASAKRINQGKNDNVVLPRQQASVYPTMCAKSQGPVQLVLYDATHYDTMVKSLGDTLGWMSGIRSGQKPATTCSR